MPNNKSHSNGDHIILEGCGKYINVISDNEGIPTVFPSYGHADQYAIDHLQHDRYQVVKLTKNLIL